ncbi:tetratricopeptide (TPR) repeat protein [Streptosporangium becharense]|uniref:Tetratricopeptide (TPR) repeat protein n=1 Tax=Streptosporangium becharense TaxID=1816182 RepID=A0A7W9MIN0_9ACTN|nr:hypothetical protein [Streptosporangium becharense]MBB2911141.1 tetratricopeptide (TPR) repeat protein [Streptosporangium becharense]MBB5821801.1 tetratricopeptide (TPR) repeat protein [Streptosporangium becharense]
MDDDLSEIRALVEAGDVSEVVRRLRFSAEELPLTEVARLAGWAATETGFEDLADASARVVADPLDPKALFDFGYACIERGVSALAVPVFREVLRLAPASSLVLGELVTALEDEGRHGEAVEVLERHEATLHDWPDRYLLVYNSIMSGDLERAGRNYARLSEPDDPRWLPAWARGGRMLARAESARRVAPLDWQDLRGWHFTLTGGVLGTLSPYGFVTSMNGRYAYLQDDIGGCLRGLLRLRLIIDAAGLRPRTVSLLPDRSSRILGLAAAEVLGVPAEPFTPDRPDTVVVAYSLDEVDGDVLADLWNRVPGQVLYEHATCWTDPPALSADVSTLLRQHGASPWGGKRMWFKTDGSPAQISLEDAWFEMDGFSPADRPAEDVAAEIVRADPTPDPGDGETPADPDEGLAAFVAGIRDRWLDGPRERVRASGPVLSFRFA